MSQQHESWPQRNEQERPGADATANHDFANTPTLRLRRDPERAGGVTTPRRAPPAVAEIQPETVRLPSIDLLPTTKLADKTVKLPDVKLTPFVARRRWRSMVVALSIFLIANVVVQLNRNAVDAQSDGYYGMSRIQQCESLGRVPDVIYAGSSRTVYGVNPQLIDSLVQQQTGKSALGCSDATFGSTIDHDYYMFKKLIDDGYAPKVLVENAWEYTLNVHAIGSKGAFSAADYGSLTMAEAPWIANVSDVSDLRQKLKVGSYSLKDFLIDRAIPVYGDRYGLLNILCQGSKIGPCAAPLPGVDALALRRYHESDKYGYVPLTGQSLADLDANGRANALREYSYGKNLNDFTIGGHQVGYLHQLIELAQAHHVTVVLVTSPMDSIFFTYLHPASDWQTKIVPYWESIAAQYHINYYDESQSPTFTDADFWDPEHLDVSGANKYSLWLAQTVIAPALGG